MNDLVGQRLGGYNLLRLLGEGGYASVYLGESPDSPAPVAIKVFHQPLRAEEGEMFRQDEVLLTHLTHPHLVRVLACGVEGSTAFLMMAYVPGGTLRQRHPPGSRLELPIIGSYVQQLASALQYLHDAQLVHGNLKSENILVDTDEQVLLSDFATPLMAQRLRVEGSPEATRTSTYLAPEHLQGRRQPASDQYALAILVYEWLTGQPPFAGSVEDLGAQHLFASPASLRGKLPDLPAAVEQVVLTALSKDPRHRFASVQDFSLAFLSAAQLPAAPLREVDEPGSPVTPERPATQEVSPAADAPLSLFISYAHADSAFVDRLEADLHQQGFDPWVDRQRLKGGQRWRRELQDAVKRAQVLLLVLSPDAITSQNVQIEYEYVLDLGKAVIPLYYRQCEVPMELRTIQWIDFRHSYEQGRSALLDVLHRQQEQQVASSSPPQEGAGLPQGRPASPAAAEVASSLPAQQPAAPEPPSVQHEPAAAGLPAFNNLPAQLTPLIGREQDIQAVCALVREPEVRLVTLLGPGGVGKTRLGLAVAQNVLSDFADGVCFVPLAPIRDVKQVIPTIARTLGLWEAADQPLLSQLQAALHERHLLLVLDNFEQVVPAAPSLVDLLVSCAHLCILVTSRSALHLVGEHEFPVLPLETPDLTEMPESQQLAEAASVALFVARARAIQPSFRLTPANAQSIAEICVRLDGLPLAIELAAARSKLLPPQALLKRLSHRFDVLTGGAQNLPSRQQTLHNTLQWSYDLLTAEEQRLFRWLSVFVGGCTLEAAEAVCRREGEPEMEVLEGVTSLLDKSLLQLTAQEEEEPRLLLLETIREYGQECLQAAGELAAAEQAHAVYYLQLAEEAEPQLQGPGQVVWQERLKPEHQNLRAAIEWALSSGGSALALRISSALWLFWFRLGYPREGSALLEHVLAGSAAAAAPLRAKALQAAAALAFVQQDFRRYGQIIEAYQPLVQELGDPQGMAVARLRQGMIALQRHPDAAGWARLEESLADLRKHGDPWWITAMLYSLGRLAFRQGDAPRGLALLEECLTRARATGDTLFQTWMLLSLGQLALTQGDLATAQARLEEGLAQSQGTGERSTTPYALTLQGLIRWRQGKTDEARASFQESVRIYREQGTRWGIARLLLLLGHIAVEEGDMAEAHIDYAESLSMAREIEFEGYTATSLKGLGVVVATEDQLALAARLWGAAEQLRESQDVSIPVAMYEQAVQAARTRLGEQVFAAAWQEGRTMKLEQVIDDALKLRAG